MRNNVRTIMLLGAPGVGKSTLSMILKNNVNNLKTFSVRVYTQYLQTLDNELSREIDRVAIPNKIMPIETVEKIFEVFMDDINKDDLIIFEGFPINKEQFLLANKKLNKYNREIDVILYLTADKKILNDRVNCRKICYKCEKNNLSGMPIDSEHINCPFCGNRLGKRIEDNNEQFEIRYSRHLEQISYILDNLKGVPCIKIDTSNLTKNQVIEKVYNNLNL